MVEHWNNEDWNNGMIKDWDDGTVQYWKIVTRCRVRVTAYGVLWGYGAHYKLFLAGKACISSSSRSITDDINSKSRSKWISRAFL